MGSEFLTYFRLGVGHIADLRGYRRITLAPRETRTVEFTVGAQSLAYWDAAADRWVVEDEDIELQAGASSADIKLTKTIRLSPRRQ